MMNNDYSGAFQPDFSQSLQQPTQQQQTPQQASSYPALPNAYGLGQVQQPQQQQQQPDAYAQQKQQAEQQMMANSSHGFNPWSLTGESMAR